MICRGCSEASSYIRKKRYGNLEMTEVKELPQLREENARLKRLVADLTLDKHILSDVVQEGAHEGDTTPSLAQLKAGALSDHRDSVVSARRAVEGVWYKRSMAKDQTPSQLLLSRT